MRICDNRVIDFTYIYINILYKKKIKILYSNRKKFKNLNQIFMFIFYLFFVFFLFEKSKNFEHIYYFKAFFK